MFLTTGDEPVWAAERGGVEGGSEGGIVMMRGPSTVARETLEQRCSRDRVLRVCTMQRVVWRVLVCDKVCRVYQ